MTTSPRLRAVVHIGPMKTGTTALAAFLSRSSRAGNLPAGLVYPTDELWWPREGLIVKHHALTSASLEHDTSSNPLRRSRDEVLARLDSIAAIVRANATVDTTVFFVAEGVSRHARASVMTEVLRERFDEVVYCFVARGQVHAHASAMSHRIKGQALRRRSVAQIVRRWVFDATGRRRYDYARMYERWGMLDGARLVVVPFFEHDIATYDLIERVLHATDTPIPPREEGIDGKRIHPVLDARSLRRLASLKRAISLSLLLPPVRQKLIARFEAEKSEAQIRARDGSAGYTAWQLSARKQQAIRRSYAASNERFSHLLAEVRSEPLWDAWFAEQRPRGRS